MEVEKELIRTVYKVLCTNIRLFNKYDISLFSILLFIIVGSILIKVLRNLLDF